MQKILIIGATSAIAEATAKRFAQQGSRLYLLARNQERVQSLASDLEIRGAASVAYGILDVNDVESHQTVLDTAIKTLGGIDSVLIAHGTLPEQKSCEQSFATTLEHLNTNLISVISLLTHLANQFEQQKHGVIAVISSVAGDRGRQSNYVYGAAKGGLSIFLQGLRNRLDKSGVSVLTIKPGFVDTPMTHDIDKNFLWALPETVAKKIEQSIDAKKECVYIPGFWWLIMLIIKSIPEKLFKKLNL